MLPFKSRKDLTKYEKTALMCYRDLEYPQHTWSYKLRNNRPNTDCDIINGYLRGTIAKTKFKVKELRALKSLIRAITRAINKSIVSSNFTVYKGVSYFPELKNYIKNKRVVDKAFNSFTTSSKKALEYSGKNKNGESIIFALQLNKGDKAVFIDNKEKEWLIQKHSCYQVMEIRHLKKSKIWGKAIIYYLKLIIR